VNNPLRAQSLPVLTLLTSLVGLGVVLQLWLLGTSLDGLLRQSDDAALPATVASLALFFVNLGLLGYALHLDRRVREYSPPAADRNDRGEQ
jgi:hypothetical protein